MDHTSPVGLAHALTSPTPARRLEATEAVTDLANSLSSDDVALLVHVLVAVRMVETNDDCQESELHALATLKESHHLSAEALARLRYLRPESVPGSQVEHLEWLLNDRG